MKPVIKFSFGTIFIFLFRVCLAQGTLQITFDGPPDQPPGSSYNVQSYYESGMWFLPLSGTDGFGRVWSNPPTGLPNDGTPYLNASAVDSLSFGFTDGRSFGLSAVNLAGYSTVVPDFSVEFIGYRPDGSAITESFSGSGIKFQTYYFDSAWYSGLTKVEIPDYGWSLDNLVVAVPEPGICTFSVLGVIVFWQIRRRKKL